MKETVKLYYEDVYLSRFKATVLDITKRDDLYDIILDKTAFFPEGGGQIPDGGTLAGGEVCDVQIKDEIITHTVSFKDTTPPAPNDEVEGVLDYEKRFSLMQQHSGEHIFSGLVKEIYGFDNVGFHLSEHTVTMDFNGPLSADQIKDLETKANSMIHRCVPISASYPEPEVLESMDYRAKLDASQMGRVRIIDVDGGDKCACCGTHVTNSGEIGILKIVDSIKYKGGVRLTLVCGMRALNDYRTKHDDLVSLSQRLSVPMPDIQKALDKKDAEIESLKAKLHSFEEMSLNITVEDAKKSGNKLLVVFCQVGDKILLRNTANSLMEEHSLFIFNGDDATGYSFIVASKKDDAKDMLHRLSEKLNIKGGGKNPLLSGSCPATKEAILSALKTCFPGEI